jgi:hypothetical protein
MCSLACKRIRHITRVSHISRVPPRTLNLNFNHSVIPKSVNPSRIEGGFYIIIHLSRPHATPPPSNSKPKAHRALRRRDQAVGRPRRQTRAAVSRMYARVVSPLALSLFLALYSNRPAPARFQDWLGLPWLSRLRRPNCLGVTKPITLKFFLPDVSGHKPNNYEHGIGNAIWNPY